MIDPEPHFRPLPGQAEDLSPGLRRILAPNPSPMTFRGTNTYLVGETDIAVIDPGPDSRQHLEAILAAIRPDQQISHILVSHAHLDHAPLARKLADHAHAPVLGFGPAEAGRSEIMQALAESGLAGGGEGVDAEFMPDDFLEDGAVVSGDGWSLTALHTPGHMANHLCFAWKDVLFSADLVMGWSTSLVSPPDGDLTAFMASLRKLRQQDWQIFFPGHGAPVQAPAERLETLLAHRQSREASILAELSKAPATARDLAVAIYTDIAAQLLPAAERNVLAHLIDLHSKNCVLCKGELAANAVFARL